MQTTFDTLSYAEALKDAGVPDAQARIHAQTLRSLIDSEIATKRDVEVATQRLMAEIELSTSASRPTWSCRSRTWRSR